MTRPRTMRQSTQGMTGGGNGQHHPGKFKGHGRKGPCKGAVYGEVESGGGAKSEERG